VLPDARRRSGQHDVADACDIASSAIVAEVDLQAPERGNAGGVDDADDEV